MEQDTRPQLVHGYTIALGVVTALLANTSIVLHWLAASRQPGAHDPFWLMMARLFMLTAICFGVVTLLRAIRSPLARGATLALNALICLSFPFGTAAFFYWLLAIRKREQASE